MILPNFAIVGAMKAGTTSLASYLSEHRDVFMCEPKEPGFFSHSRYAPETVQDYARLFEGAGGHLAIGEASTDYTKAPEIPDVPKRLARLLPDARIIYIVRNPVDRIRSMYRHEVGRSREHRKLAEVVFSDPRYLDFSRYGFQMDQYLEFFPLNQICVVRTEDLRDHRADTLNRIAAHLGIAASWSGRDKFESHNVAAQWKAYPKALEPARRIWHSLGIRRFVPAQTRHAMRRQLQSRPIPDSATELNEADQGKIWSLLESDFKKLSLTFDLPEPLWDAGRV